MLLILFLLRVIISTLSDISPLLFLFSLGLISDFFPVVGNIVTLKLLFKIFTAVEVILIFRPALIVIELSVVIRGLILYIFHDLFFPKRLKNHTSNGVGK